MPQRSSTKPVAGTPEMSNTGAGIGTRCANNCHRSASRISGPAVMARRTLTSNPFIRLPASLFDQPIPVAVVSNSYSLAQHTDVAERCFAGLESTGIRVGELRCELGLTELGERMNLRIHFPDQYSHVPIDGHRTRLRLECMNSVDGSSRLVILLSWFRLICTNGMVVPNAGLEIRDLHNEHLNLERIPKQLTSR